MPTVRLKGRKAGSFFASLMVENHGFDALNKCAEGSPIWHEVKAVLESQETETINSNTEISYKKSDES